MKVIFILILSFGPIKFLMGQAKYSLGVDEYSILMTPVSAGTFLWASETSTKVGISGFWMSATEVPWELYDKFVYETIDQNDLVSAQMLKELGIDGVTRATTPYVDMSFGMGKMNKPAAGMTQYGALMFCKWLSARTGQFYRLPTEAEWEYACKTGKTESVDLKAAGWYKENSELKYSGIGQKLPNAYGIFDMLGNVGEWTMDQYSEGYSPRNNARDPWKKPTQLYPRVVRGGSWKDDKERVNCTERKPSSPNWKRRDPQMPKSKWWHTNAPFVGIRLVRPFAQPEEKEIRKYWLEAMDDFN